VSDNVFEMAPIYITALVEMFHLWIKWITESVSYKTVH